MRRRTFLFTSVAAGCKVINFSFDYSYFDGPAQLHTSLMVRGTVGTLIRQVASGAEKPIGVTRGTLSAKTQEALWSLFPAAGPSGPPLMPGMPNHWFVMKREGTEKTVRLAGSPGVLEQVRPFITAVEAAMHEAAATAVRTVAVRWRGWGPTGAEVELVAAGTDAILVPEGALVVVGGPEEIKGPALRLAAGSKTVVTVAMKRENGKGYQAVYRRRGMTEVGGSDVFGDASSGMAPR